MLLILFPTNISLLMNHNNEFILYQFISLYAIEFLKKCLEKKVQDNIIWDVTCRFKTYVIPNIKHLYYTTYWVVRKVSTIWENQ